MKLDQAAAAYRRVYDACTVEEDEGSRIGEGILDSSETYHVRLHDGTVLQPGMSHDDATALLEQEAGRAAVVAVLREIISPDTLSRGAHHAGCTLRKFENNAINQGRKPSLALLNGILAALEEDANGR